jgi:hypothetical protein
MRHLYLHGFASSAGSKKGTHLAHALGAQGIELVRLELAVPSFARLSPRAALEVVDEAAGDGPVRLLGSSLGGWLAAVWAERHPERVERMVLLCPAFALAERWPLLLGPDGFERWRREGAFVFDDAFGVPTPVWWGFVEEAVALPPWPSAPCPTLVIHGRGDEVVPYDGSARWVAAQEDARLVGVDDDHALAESLDGIAAETIRFLGLRATTGT